MNVGMENEEERTATSHDGAGSHVGLGKFHVEGSGHGGCEVKGSLSESGASQIGCGKNEGMHGFG